MKPQPPRNPADLPDFNRRDFLKGSSAATLAALVGGGTPLVLSTAHAEEPAKVGTQSGQKVKVAVIGCGAWGREVLNTLARLPSVEVVALSDTYAAMIRRAKEAAPGA